MIFCMVFVVSLKTLNFHIFVEGGIYILATFYIKLEIWNKNKLNINFPILWSLEQSWETARTIKWFFSCRLEIHVDAFYIIHMMPFKQLLYGPLDNCSLHQWKECDYHILGHICNSNKNFKRPIAIAIAIRTQSPSSCLLAFHTELCLVLGHHVA